MANECLLCQLPAEGIEVDAPKILTKYVCRRCGTFWIDTFLTFRAEERALLPYLSAHTRQSFEQGITASILDNWQDLARAHASTSVPQKAIKLLELAAKRTKTPGKLAEIFPDDDYPLLDASGHGEVVYLMDYLVDMQYIKSIDHLPVVTVKGWERLEPPEGGEPGRCFVAMWFDDSMKDAYEKGIYPAVKACGFDPIRVDRYEHNRKIDDEIIIGIRRSQFLVADFTGQRGGVYFEAGFALGLGRPVIWLCRKDELAKVHFDTNHYNHIDWSTPEELRKRLTDRIRATIKGAKLS
jgi:hypothetical protein